MKLMISCKKAAELDALAEERMLTLSERINLNLHLLVCKACRLLRLQLRLIRRALREQKTDSSVDEDACKLPDDARLRIQKKLEDSIN